MATPYSFVPLFLVLSCSTCGTRQAEVPASEEAALLLDQSGQFQGGDAHYELNAERGDQLEVAVTTDDFDPILEVTPPGAAPLSNDDFEGQSDESRLTFVVGEAGPLKINVRGAGQGTFRLVARRLSRALGATVIAAGATKEGELAAGDELLTDGRFSERFSVAGSDAGPLDLRIHASGTAVPLAVLIAPDGSAVAPTQSGIYPIRTPGIHRLQLLSPAAGERAGYRITLERAGTATAAAGPVRAHHALPSAADGAPLVIGANVNASLGDGNDVRLPTGESSDVYTIRGEAGQSVRIEHRSEAFDAYLVVVAPSGQVFENDDYAGAMSSALDVTFPVSGNYRVIATAYRSGMAGAYALKVSPGNALSVLSQGVPVAGGPVVGPATTAAAINQTGTLATGDRTLNSGEFVDSYSYPFAAGQTFDIRVTSSDFDTYVIVRAPDGQQQDNDDESDSNRNARLQYTAAAAGTYQVLVTSYTAGGTGSYALSIQAAGQGVAPTPNVATPPTASGENVDGTLDGSDRTLTSGEFADVHSIRAQAGERITLRAESSAFDSYLLVRDPAGEQHDNDDGTGTGTNAELTLVAPSAGEYQVTVTSYRPGETGAYRLLVSRGGSSAPAVAAMPNAPAAGAGEGTLRGRLSGASETLARTFAPGSRIRIGLRSSAFDPVLVVTSPSGARFENDDINSTSRDSGIEIPSAEAGNYQILVRSYEPGRNGDFELLFERGAEVPRASSGAGGSRLFGIFVGITDYPAGVGDLPECANDAIKLAQSLREAGLLSPDRQTILTDGQATSQNLRDAFARYQREMQPTDVFLFFYSGHGGQTNSSTDVREIDGKDEYLVLTDGPFMDDAASGLMDNLRVGMSVVALDSCHSGGFAKDLITRPGRVGFFSSEEDVLSAVASQFQAGGYLSHFLRLAVQGDADRSPRDGALTVGEMSHFLYTQFGQHASDVELQGAYQHLVVDRGAVTSDHVLWSYR